MNAAAAPRKRLPVWALRRAVRAALEEGPAGMSVESVFHAALRQMSREVHDLQLVGAESLSGEGFERKEDDFQFPDTSSSWLHAGRP